MIFRPYARKNFSVYLRARMPLIVHSSWRLALGPRSFSHHHHTACWAKPDTHRVAAMSIFRRKASELGERESFLICTIVLVK